MLKIFATASLAAMLALGAGGASPALAGEAVVITLVHIEFHDDDSWTETWKDKKGNIYLILFDEDGKYMGVVGPGNPNPEGGSTGLVDYKSIIEEATKNGGSEFILRVDPYKTPLGEHLMGKSIVPHHNPDPLLDEDTLGKDPLEQEKNQGSMGGGWYDPMGGSMTEQMIKAGKKNKGKKDNKGSGDAASDAKNPGYAWPADPALVNPVPILKSAAKPVDKKAKLATAPALKRKGKVSTVRKFKSYTTIPNLPGPTTTGRIHLPKFGSSQRRKMGAASGNLQRMVVQGGARRKLR